MWVYQRVSRLYGFLCISFARFGQNRPKLDNSSHPDMTLDDFRCANRESPSSNAQFRERPDFFRVPEMWSIYSQKFFVLYHMFKGKRSTVKTGWWFGRCFFSPSYWECHDPNWSFQSIIFRRGWAIPTTNPIPWDEWWAKNHHIGWV